VEYFIFPENPAITGQKGKQEDAKQMTQLQGLLLVVLHHIMISYSFLPLVLLPLLFYKFTSCWDDFEDVLIFLLSIDGTCCPIEEPCPFSMKWSSHKLGGKSGINYVIGLKIHESKLLWVSGPSPLGRLNNLQVFCQGLKDKIPAGKHVIGDDGYTEEPDFISIKNEFDPREIAEFKERVLSHHESFNKHLEIFRCLMAKFHHVTLAITKVPSRQSA
jgi:hypothetical protein